MSDVQRPSQIQTWFNFTGPENFTRVEIDFVEDTDGVTECYKRYRSGTLDVTPIARRPYPRQNHS